MYEARTKDILIRVTPLYDDERSKPDRGHYFWLYTVEIENDGSSDVQLISRYWRITDAQGRVQEVRGEGVVGQQPLIAPGQTFRYTSGAPLPTPTGFMAGSYQMEGADGALFDVEIPTFSLDSPFTARSLN
jgi:ApaG protein